MLQARSEKYSFWQFMWQDRLLARVSSIRIEFTTTICVFYTSGLDRTGPDWTGPDWTGLDRTGPDWTGPDWTGLDRTGPDWTGLDRTGPDW